MKQHFMNYKTASAGVNEGKGDFEMSVTGVFRKCLEQQVFTGVRIQKCEDEGGSLLNSKKEFSHPNMYRQCSNSGDIKPESTQPSLFG